MAFAVTVASTNVPDVAISPSARNPIIALPEFRVTVVLELSREPPRASKEVAATTPPVMKTVRASDA
jgi:hypothetical protein